MTVNDHMALQAIAETADLLGRSRSGDCFLLVRVPSEVFEYLATLDDIWSDLEPDFDNENSEYPWRKPLTPDPDAFAYHAAVQSGDRSWETVTAGLRAARSPKQRNA